jgi:hypothetical protein
LRGKSVRTAPDFALKAKCITKKLAKRGFGVDSVDSDPLGQPEEHEQRDDGGATAADDVAGNNVDAIGWRHGGGIKLFRGGYAHKGTVTSEFREVTEEE